MFLPAASPSLLSTLLARIYGHYNSLYQDLAHELPGQKKDLVKLQNEANFFRYYRNRTSVPVGGELNIKTPNFLVTMQMSRIQAAQGSPLTDAIERMEQFLRDKSLRMRSKGSAIFR